MRQLAKMENTCGKNTNETYSTCSPKIQTCGKEKCREMQEGNGRLSCKWDKVNYSI